MIRRVICLALLCLAVGILGEQARFDGHKVVRVLPHTLQELAGIKTFLDDHEQLDVWKGPRALGSPVDVRVSPKAYPLLATYLHQQELNYTIMIPDLQSILDEESRQMAARKALQNGKEPRLDYGTYNRHATIMSWLDEVAASCSFCELFNIGKSYGGRDLKVIKIGASGTNKRSIFINGAIHAREWITPSTVIHMIRNMVDSYGSDSTVTKLVDSFDWYFMPVMNPDGYEHSHTSYRMWRKTRSPNSNPSCPGTDANRNWDFHWMEVGASNNPCSDTYGGQRAFSEVETTATSNFIWARRSTMVAYLDIHSYGQYWMPPWGYTRTTPSDYSELERVAKIAVAAMASVSARGYTIGSPPMVLYAAAGGTFDWAKGVAGVKYSYALELPDTGYYGFALPTYYIDPVGREIYTAILAMGNALYDVYF